MPFEMARYTHFNSMVPRHYFHGILHGAVVRAHRYCTSKSASIDAIMNLVPIWLRRQYPLAYLRQRLAKSFTRIFGDATDMLAALSIRQRLPTTSVTAPTLSPTTHSSSTPTIHGAENPPQPNYPTPPPTTASLSSNTYAPTPTTASPPAQNFPLTPAAYARCVGRPPFASST